MPSYKKERKKRKKEMAATLEQVVAALKVLYGGASNQEQLKQATTFVLKRERERVCWGFSNFFCEGERRSSSSCSRSCWA
jgi:hypothetical protein